MTLGIGYIVAALIAAGSGRAAAQTRDVAVQTNEVDSTAAIIRWVADHIIETTSLHL